jgi:hypothetical protein
MPPEPARDPELTPQSSALYVKSHGACIGEHSARRPPAAQPEEKNKSKSESKSESESKSKSKSKSESESETAPATLVAIQRFSDC